MGKSFTLKISLEDEWASNLRITDNSDSVRRLLRRLSGQTQPGGLGLACSITDSGKVIDPNGNTIGEWEVSGDE